MTESREFFLSDDAQRVHNAEVMGVYATDEEVMKSVNMVGMFIYTIVMIATALAFVWFLDHQPVPHIPTPGM